MTFTPSSEQLAFFSALSSTPDNLMLLASAGSGKTTTIVHACSHLPPGHSARFLAFNKNIATELKERLPDRVESSTFHSLGLAAIKAYGDRPKIDGDKLRNLLKPCLKPSEFGLIVSPVTKLVAHAKAAGKGTVASGASWKDLISRFDLEIPDDTTEERVTTVAEKLLAESNNTWRTSVDFDDMLYIPLLLGLDFPKVNFLFIDETQDTNSVQRHLIPKMLWPSPNGRLIAVGDPDQSIYGFRGADSSAMELLRDQFSMKTFPLSVSYRCAKLIVKEAQKYCKGLKPKDSTSTN